MLIHTISFESQSTIRMNIHNQCSNFNLVNRKWYKVRANWNEIPDLEVDAGSTMNAVLTSCRAEFRGAIIYRLQKCVKSDDQLESTSTLLFIVWKYEGCNEPRVFAKLVECDKAFDWRKVDIREYYQRHANQLDTYTDPIKDTWLTRDGTVFMTRLELDFTQTNSVLNIVISEGIKDEHVKRPIWIHPRR
jgi:hypothetical protein